MIYDFACQAKNKSP